MLQHAWNELTCQRYETWRSTCFAWWLVQWYKSTSIRCLEAVFAKWFTDCPYHASACASTKVWIVSSFASSWVPLREGYQKPKGGWSCFLLGLKSKFVVRTKSWKAFPNFGTIFDVLWWLQERLIKVKFGKWVAD